MIEDMFIHRCNVYRLMDFVDYDFTGAAEGEVDETWGITTLNAPSMFEPEDTSMQRRSDGVVDIGTHLVFMDKSTIVQNGDRIYWAASEGGAAYYNVKMVKPIRDMHYALHHYEVHLEHIDWIAPVVVTAWITAPNVPNVSVREMAFSYRDREKLITDIMAQDWLQVLSIQVIVPFDDPTASLTIGDASGNDSLFDAAFDLTIRGNFYEKTTSQQYSINDNIRLYLDPQDSTQGSGVIFAQVLMNS